MQSLLLCATGRDVLVDEREVQQLVEQQLLRARVAALVHALHDAV